jgi:hypothetical protein
MLARARHDGKDHLIMAKRMCWQGMMARAMFSPICTIHTRARTHKLRPVCARVQVCNHTHARTHTRTQTHTHTHTHTHILKRYGARLLLAHALALFISYLQAIITRVNPPKVPPTAAPKTLLPPPFCEYKHTITQHVHACVCVSFSGYI